MTAKKLYFLQFGILGVLFIGILGAGYAINNNLSERSKTLVNLKAEAEAATQQSQSLTRAKSDIKKYTELKNIAKTVVPEDKNQAEIVRQIVNIAAANGVNLASVTFPASTLGTAPSTNSSASTAKLNSNATNPNSKTNGLSQLQPVSNIPGVYSLLITVQSNPDQPVQYNRFINFLSALERNRRTSQVTTIALEPSSTNSNALSFTLTLNGYIKP